MKEWDEPFEKSGRIKTQGFRPATVEAYRETLLFKYKVKDLGSDICYVYCSFAQSFNAWQNGLKSKNPKALIGTNVINFQQNNQFNYAPQVPRREPLNIANSSISGTVYREALDAYILLKALRMEETFCCGHFPKLSSDCFKKAIRRLKRKGFIEPMEPRTNPRFYRLTPKFLLPLAKEHGYKLSEFYPSSTMDNQREGAS